MRTLVFLSLIVTFMSCNQTPASQSIEQQVDSYLANGQFGLAEALINNYLSQSELDSITAPRLRYQLDWMKRVRIDFGETRLQVREQLAEYYPQLTDSMLDAWEASKLLEMRLIDGQKWYFNRAVSNFFRLNPEARRLREQLKGPMPDAVASFQQRYVPQLFATQPAVGLAADTRRMRIHYTMSLKPNEVPPGETVRCWMPFPRLHPRLTKVSLLSSSEANYQLAPESQMQRSIYFEKKAVHDSATVFELHYEVETNAVWHPLSTDVPMAYDTASTLYKAYTAERPPHIQFSDSIRRLAKDIVGTATHPVEQVQRIYYWMNEHIPWSGALEYSIMPNIPQYVLEHQRGDCGMQTFLFLSLVRSLGIPAKWQSGWYVLPEEINLHDWAEVYFPGAGWVPVDPSFKLIASDDERVRNFYLNGLDSYRLIINDDYARDLWPTKEHLRSEPLDFQRGEMEWRGGNLYFNQWRYKLRVEYL